MFTDERRYTVWEQIRKHDLRAFARLMPESLLRQAAAQAGLKIIHCALSLPNLVWLGMAAAIHTSRSFADGLCLTVRILDLAANGQREPIQRARKNARRRKPARSKHDPHAKDPATLSQEAFARARQRKPLGFWIALILLPTERFEDQHERLVRWKRFRLLALDGTTLRLPQQRRREDHFAAAGNAKARTVQARRVMLQLPLVRVPWRYPLGPLCEGERTIARRLLADVRINDRSADGSGLLELRAVSSNSKRPSLFCHPALSPRPSENAQASGTEGASGPLEETHGTALSANSTCRRRSTCAGSSIRCRVFAPAPW